MCLIHTTKKTSSFFGFLGDVFIPHFLKDVDIMGQQELLSIFELEPNASWDEVRSAYRRLAKEWHPDRFTANERLQQRAECFARQLNSAFEELERIYINGAWIFASSALGYTADPQVEPDFPIKEGDSAKNQEEDSGWNCELFGLPIDIGVLTTALGLAAVLCLPILYALGAEIPIRREVIHPFQSGIETVSHWGYSFSQFVTGKVLSVLATL
jgi:hypothetical protein